MINIIIIIVIIPALTTTYVYNKIPPGAAPPLARDNTAEHFQSFRNQSIIKFDGKKARAAKCVRCLVIKPKFFMLMLLLVSMIVPGSSNTVCHFSTRVCAIFGTYVQKCIFFSMCKCALVSHCALHIHVMIAHTCQICFSVPLLCTCVLS